MQEATPPPADSCLSLARKRVIDMDQDERELELLKWANERCGDSLEMVRARFKHSL